ncbi:MAG TPA: ABC transporter ATP-binding protein [Mycobacteriales bacterium]|jgi:simple sugar transport system ATP-binding protein|nr:ABC transporter ATP-binding protein [Mycobacteriales bacterium]
MKLELEGITKRFGDLVANDGIDLTVEPGEIHCLLGENGAGKSTLMNVLFGLLRPDGGEIKVDGKVVRFADPGDAIAQGIGMVHQHFMLVPVFSVAENVVLGFEPTRQLGFLDRKEARSEIRRLSAEFGLEVDPDAIVEDLPVGLQQRVEILKALLRDVSLLILDEPTAVLTPQETEGLFTIMRSLAASGRSILFITHKLKEVLALAERITVVRQGRVIGTTTPSESNEQDLATMMVGRNVDLVVRKQKAKPGETVLELSGLTLADDRGVTTVDHVDLTVRAGEIVALAGVQGNGQTELSESLLGLQHVSSGTVELDGKNITGTTPRAALRAGIAYIPEDRQLEGLVLGMSISDNLVLDLHDQAPYARRGARNLTEVHDSAQRKLSEFDIRASSVDTPVGTLSGGNQQKVVAARELSRPVRLLVASQPTRGLDVGSIEYVHRRIIAERDRGVAVLLVSSELDEILALADRVAVMCRGAIVGIVPPSAGREEIGLMMGGAASAAAEQPAKAAK